MIIDWNFLRSSQKLTLNARHAAPVFPQHLENRATHKANVKAQRRAANRVARRSRRINRIYSR